MKELLIAASVFAMITTSSSALVGENESQITKRYGASIGDIPTETFGKVRGFMGVGYVVGVAFVGGVSSMEMFSKADQSAMSAVEIETLLKANGADPWKSEKSNKADWKRWGRDDGSLIALYDAKRHFLYINSKTYYESQNKKAGKE